MYRLFWPDTLLEGLGRKVDMTSSFVKCFSDCGLLTASIVYSTFVSFSEVLWDTCSKKKYNVTQNYKLSF